MDHVTVPFQAAIENQSISNRIITIDRDAFGEPHVWHWDNFIKPLPFKDELSFLTMRGSDVSGFIIASAYKLGGVTTTHINRIAVATIFNGMGIGRKLVHRVQDACGSVPSSSITLEFDSSLLVRPFYESLGYRPLQPSYLDCYLNSKGKEHQRLLYESGQRLVFIKQLHP